jgi:hypothetical protein
MRRLQQAGVTLFGCDVDVRALIERVDPGPVCAATLEALPFADDSFDFVSANMVFEHLTKPEATVRELARVTRPGGRILVHTVNGRHYLSWIARLTPHRFHEWIVGRIERRAAKDVYPTEYRANTVGRLMRLFEAAGCQFRQGGLIDGTPLYVPYSGLFYLAIGIGIIERQLARVPGLGALLRPNLLMEFQRRDGLTRNEGATGTPSTHYTNPD